MGFRDDLEAARARTDALEREVVALRERDVVLRRERDVVLRREHRAKRGRVWVAPAVAAVVAALLTSVGAVMIARSGNPRTDAIRLAEANQAYVTARRESAELRAQLHHRRAWATFDPPDAGVTEAESEVDWTRPGTGSASWSGEVTERIGDARAGIGARCTITLQQTEPRTVHGAPPCDVVVVCDDRAVYPAPGETSSATCWLQYGDGYIVNDLEGGARSRRVRARNGVVRVDDGPVGTWSFAFE